MTNTVKDILTWFEKAKPEPTQTDIVMQAACHYEEVAEMCEPLGFTHTQTKLESLADYMKSEPNTFVYVFERLNEQDKLDLLDALCDQIVTALGVGYMMGFDMEKALAEVNRSNYSKFENGEPVFNEQGKIAKGKGYTPPDLKPFLGV